MQSWKNFSANLPAMPVMPAVDVSSVGKNFRNTVQATRCVQEMKPREVGSGTDILLLPLLLLICHYHHATFVISSMTVLLSADTIGRDSAMLVQTVLPSTSSFF